MKQILLIIVFYFAWGSDAPARQLHVPTGYTSIQAAFDSSAAGDTVLVAPGTYNELLTAPTHDLTLASNYLFTRDTLDIVGTMLDGQLQGTVITLPTGDYWFSLDGFIVRGGWGGTGYIGAGGALKIRANVNIDLKNLVFTGNGATDAAWGAAVHGGFWLEDLGPVGEVRMTNIQITNNYHVAGCPSPREPAFMLRSTKRVTASRVFCNGAGWDDRAITLSTSDSLFADSIRVIGYRGAKGSIAGFAGGGLCEVKHVVVRDNRIYGIAGGWFGCYSGDIHADSSHLILEDILVEQNSDSTESAASRRSVSFEGDFVTASNVVIRENSGLAGYIMGVVAFEQGLIRNMVVEDNVVGREEGLVEGLPDGMVWLKNVSLDSVRFHRNTAHLPRATGVDYRWSSVVRGEYRLDDGVNLSWEHVSFRDNWVHDHNLLENNHHGLLGRATYLEGLFGGSLRFEDCEWVNNRVNIIVPEWELWPEPRNVGSTVELYGSYGQATRTDIYFNNCLFQDNDDGGLYAAEFGSGLIQNCRFLRNNRYALVFYSNNNNSFINLRNNWIHETDMQQYFIPYPQYQGILTAFGRSGTLIENLTASSCSTSFAIAFGGNHSEPATVSNTIFSSNTNYEFVRPQEFLQEASYHHCISESPLPGEGNLVLDAAFDPDFGPPYLSPFSPAIDAGNPDSTCNDVEDPAIPGFALWPSRGTVRNDIGVTGGPFAMAPDTGWATQIPRWEPRKGPQAFTLGAPWPNPFNPATHIPYSLLQPGRVTLCVHNLLGQRVAVLAGGLKPAGTHTATFDAAGLASGIYLITLEALGKQETRTVTLLR